jgi:hypothetical protein
MCNILIAVIRRSYFSESSFCLGITLDSQEARKKEKGKIILRELIEV